ncbi:hypothetical protein ACLB2K_017788 [Fragaria x ananassa]
MYDRDPPIPIPKRIRTLKLRFSREKASGDAKTRMERFARYKRIIAGSPREANELRYKLGRYLCRAMRLPEDKHSSIIDQIVRKLQDKEADPDKVIEVAIVDVIFRDTEESMLLDFEDNDDCYRAKLIPATESFIQALEEASPPDDDDELECATCMEMFAHKNHSSIIQLPCSHYYHRDCIVPWLHINHLCPTCRHPNSLS